MEHHEKYHSNSIWVSALVEFLGKQLSLSAVPAALLVLGPLPYALTAVFFVLASGPHNLAIVVAQSSAAFVAAVGPALIWHYDERVFPRFIAEVEEVVSDTDILVKTISRYERMFAEKYWVTTSVWTVFVVAVFLSNFSFLENLGVTGLLDPALFVYLLFALWWGILTGIGFHGAIVAVLCVRAVGNLEISIDPLHPDGLGGLSSIGYFSIRATVMISVGSFALPLGFAIASEGNLQLLVYVGVACYIGAILASFAYPTLSVNRRAQEVRAEILDEKRAQIRELESQMSVASTEGEISEVETQLKIQTIREDFRRYEAVNLYPLSVSILTRLASSILLPIAFTILETYVFTG
jgi:hypothetical protein